MYSPYHVHVVDILYMVVCLLETQWYSAWWDYTCVMMSLYLWKWIAILMCLSCDCVFTVNIDV